VLFVFKLKTAQDRRKNRQTDRQTQKMRNATYKTAAH